MGWSALNCAENELIRIIVRVHLDFIQWVCYVNWTPMNMFDYVCVCVCGFPKNKQ